MSFLYLEARKGILRRYTLIALALFLCLNTVKIIADYHAGEIRPVAANTSGMQAGYDTIYERIKGPITEETVRFLTSEYQRLDALTADGTYSREPQEGTYSGYIFGDYYLLHSYFYPHMEYSVKYSSDMEEILAQAKENMTFYRESGNTAGAAENAYILHHYAGRTIPAFYLYDGWEALLSYDFSDLLILLLLILAVAPAFTREKENGMTLILSSCKRGRWPLLISKCGAGVIFAWILTILFALLNFLVFGLLCGFDGLEQPALCHRKLSIYSILRLDFAVLWIDLRVEGHRFQCDSTLADSPVRLFPKITLSMPDGIGAWRGIELLRWLGALPRVVETGPRLYQPIHLDQRQ